MNTPKFKNRDHVWRWMDTITPTVLAAHTLSDFRLPLHLETDDGEPSDFELCIEHSRFHAYYSPHQHRPTAVLHFTSLMLYDDQYWTSASLSICTRCDVAPDCRIMVDTGAMQSACRDYIGSSYDGYHNYGLLTPHEYRGWTVDGVMRSYDPNAVMLATTLPHPGTHHPDNRNAWRAMLLIDDRDAFNTPHHPTPYTG